MWQKLKTFINVAEQAGFSKAAKKMNLSKATVTRYIKELEDEYSTLLFNRSTRHVYLTEQGKILYHHVLDLLQIQANANDALQQTQTLSGHIKIGLPQSIMHGFIELILPKLNQQHPDLEFELVQGNQLYNVLSKQFDLAIHCGSLPAVDLHYASLGPWRKVLAASPQYLKQHGEPQNIGDLQKHACLDHADTNTYAWPLNVNGKMTEISIASPIKVNSSMGLVAAAKQHLGIVYLPGFCLKQAFTEKTLIPIMKDYWSKPLDAFALYPPRRTKSAKVDLITERLKIFFGEGPFCGEQNS